MRGKIDRHQTSHQDPSDLAPSALDAVLMCQSLWRISGLPNETFTIRNRISAHQTHREHWMANMTLLGWVVTLLAYSSRTESW